MTTPSYEPFLFVVDTTSYAGNFEREMCAAMTGRTGECEVGEEIAEAFDERFPNEADLFGDIIGSMADDRGTRRPVTIYPTPGLYNDGMGGEYTDNDDPQMVRDRYIKSVEDYYQRLIDQAEKATAEGRGDWGPSIRSYKTNIASAKENGPRKCPAYHSVGIWFAKEPSTEIIAFMKERAEEYAREKSITITGYRLVEYKLVETERAV